VAATWRRGPAGAEHSNGLSRKGDDPGGANSHALASAYPRLQSGNLLPMLRRNTASGPSQPAQEGYGAGTRWAASS
jgi:hypothetical protein